MAGAGLVTYIVLSEADYNRALELGELTPEFFAAPTCPWVPLKDSAEAAVESVLRSTKFSMDNWPTQAHQWYVLRVCFTPEQAIHALQQKILMSFWPADDTNYYGGFRWHGAIKLTNYAHEWTQMTLAPTGYELWADRYLAKLKGFKKLEEGVCAECSTIEVVWKVGSHSLYCAACWHGFLGASAEPE